MKLNSMKIKFFLLAALVCGLMACNSNSPTGRFEGTWRPVLFSEESDSGVIPDLFVITYDSIKAINQATHEEHYQCYYKVLNDSLAEIERCWLETNYQKEEEYKSVEHMYIDENGYLLVDKFLPYYDMAEYFPNYSILKLKRYE